MGNIWKRKTQSDISRIGSQDDQPFIDRGQQRHRPENLVTIGKNVFTKMLTEGYLIKRKTREMLGRYYIRFEKIDDRVKIGIEGDITADEEFIKKFVHCLVESHMSGFIFIGITVPLFEPIVKVNFTNLRRLQLVKCNIENIEPIAWINSDRFENIYLSRNNITNIHSIAKTRFPNFVSIELDQNRIVDFKPLTRCMMTVYDHALKNQFFVFMTLETHQSCDLSYIFKAQNKELCVVGEKARAVNLIKNNKIFDAIRRLQSPLQELPR